MPQIEIRGFATAEDEAAFRSLNEEWIRHHFALEAKDHAILGEPRRMILEKGGAILMAYAEGVPVGCVALIPMGDGIFELSKMAVSPGLRGAGIGRRLVEASLEEAKALGARGLFLGSSTKLPNAVHLYESMGFEHVPPESLPPLPYVRADVFMRRSL